MFSIFGNNRKSKDVKELMADAEDLTDIEFERKLNSFIRNHHKYKNLDRNNQQIVLDLVKKYKKNLRKGYGISSVNFRRENQKLFRNRVKLDLTENDLKDIKEIISELKR